MASKAVPAGQNRRAADVSTGFDPIAATAELTKMALSALVVAGSENQPAWWLSGSSYSSIDPLYTLVQDHAITSSKPVGVVAWESELFFKT